MSNIQVILKSAIIMLEIHFKYYGIQHKSH